MEKKKQTKEELERRMRNAVVLIPKDKEYESIWFDDKGLRLTITADFAIVETLFHRHIFNAVNALGISKPYVYISNFIHIAQANDCETKDAKGQPTCSYKKLFDSLQAREDKTQYNICWYVDKWLYNIFQPLYELGESERETFLSYETYLHNIAKNSVILEEKKKNVTNKEFINRICKLEKSFVGEGVEEFVLFEKMSDKERRELEAEAVKKEIEEEIAVEQLEQEKEAKKNG